VILLPIRDENPVQRVPWVTGVLVAANVAVFAWQLVAASPEFVAHAGFVPADFLPLPSAGGPERPPFATLLTSMFVHGNVLHLLSNLVYLWVFGNNVEDVLGRVRFLAFYVAAGLGGHVAHFLANLHSPVPTIGASGAISGILAAYLIAFPHARVQSLLFLFVFLRWVRVPAFLLIGYWLLIQVLNGAAELGGLAGGGVAWFEHLGGFFVGFVLFPVFAASTRR
jgi:membrane associated rhomboid family serine protease